MSITNRKPILLIACVAILVVSSILFIRFGQKSSMPSPKISGSQKSAIPSSDPQREEASISGIPNVTVSGVDAVIGASVYRNQWLPLPIYTPEKGDLIRLSADIAVYRKSQLPYRHLYSPVKSTLSLFEYTGRKIEIKMVDLEYKLCTINGKPYSAVLYNDEHLARCLSEHPKLTCITINYLIDYKKAVLLKRFTNLKYLINMQIAFPKKKAPCINIFGEIDENATSSYIPENYTYLPPSIKFEFGGPFTYQRPYNSDFYTFIEREDRSDDCGDRPFLSVAHINSRGEWLEGYSKTPGLCEEIYCDGGHKSLDTLLEKCRDNSREVKHLKVAFKILSKAGLAAIHELMKYNYRSLLIQICNTKFTDPIVDFALDSGSVIKSFSVIMPHIPKHYEYVDSSLIVEYSISINPHSSCKELMVSGGLMYRSPQCEATLNVLDLATQIRKEVKPDSFLSARRCSLSDEPLLLKHISFSKTTVLRTSAQRNLLIDRHDLGMLRWLSFSRTPNVETGLLVFTKKCPKLEILSFKINPHLSFTLDPQLTESTNAWIYTNVHESEMIEYPNFDSRIIRSRNFHTFNRNSMPIGYSRKDE